jgi:hypothetical protein
LAKTKRFEQILFFQDIWKRLEPEVPATSLALPRFHPKS